MISKSITMKLLTILKYSINLIFCSYILTELVIHGLSIYNGQYQNESGINFWGPLLYVLIHEIIIIMILYYLRKFVLGAEKGAPLDKSTRKYLKLSGIFCLIYGLLDCCLELPTVLELYRYSSELSNSIFAESIWTIGFLFFIIIIGLFLIYLSEVLAASDEIRQESKLTI